MNEIDWDDPIVLAEQSEELRLSHAIAIAAEAHKYTLDKGGRPYILHPLTVMFRFTDPIDQMAAVLHDLIEDTSYTLDDLWRFGFGIQVVNTVDALTRREGETVREYYDRLKGDERAVRIKMEDLSHNMEVIRFKRMLEKKDINRLKMYHKMWLELWTFKEGVIA